MIQAYNTFDPIALGWKSGWQPPDLRTICEYARANFKVPDSVINDDFDDGFDPDKAPWAVDVINDANPRGVVRFNTFVKPCQIGGSKAGEIVLKYWLKHLRRGNIQYNWESNDKAKDRWKKNFEKLLLYNPVIKEILPNDQTKYQTCLIVLDRLNFTMQGVEADANLASEPVVGQVNEEVHNWDPGKLEKAYGRVTASQMKWFHILNISNASNKGDQLWQALEGGTNRIWEHRCPGCGEFHSMRFEWNPDEPQLGGLRYDSDKCKRPDGSYDYATMRGNIRYQMPCGFAVPNDYEARRVLNSKGNCRYSDPRNPSAAVFEESRTLEAVAVHFIDWILLTKEWHSAVRAWRYGKPEVMNTFNKERRCRFIDPEERPLTHSITISSEVKKNRDGMAGRSHRFYALDRQKGELAKGEFPHWWLLIADVGILNGKLAIQIVFEGKILTDLDVIATLDSHGIEKDKLRHFGAADCTHDTTHVMAFCLQHGINAIFATGQAFFNHEGGVKHVFGPEKPLCSMISAPLKYPKQRNGLYDKREPLFWQYSKVGIMDRLHYLRTAPDVQLIIPSDVSKDFRKHMEAFIRELEKQPDGSTIVKWKQVRDRPDLFVCLCYVAMQIDMAGLIGKAISGPIQEPKTGRRFTR